jgi:GNAT superfamily N-acetyltransferase
MQPKLTMTAAPESGVREAIVGPLIAFNNSRASQPESYRPLVIILSDHDTGEILGGLWGATNFSYMHVDLLFVPDNLRGTGLGKRMMLEAEQEAIVRGCLGAWLDTYSFQARAFYERLGYTAFGILDDYPPGQHRIFLHKPLTG